MKAIHRGSCHCGAVRFECELDLAPVAKRSPAELPGVWWTSTLRCNCSFCMKTRFWKGFVRADDFRLTEGLDALSQYQFGEQRIQHDFCRHCGVHPFASGRLEQMGGAFYAVNIACLDDVTPAQWAQAPITYEDGRNDAWDRPPAQTGYL